MTDSSKNELFTVRNVTCSEWTYRRGCEETRTNCDVMEDEHDFVDMQVVEEARSIPVRYRPPCSVFADVI